MIEDEIEKMKKNHENDGQPLIEIKTKIFLSVAFIISFVVGWSLFH